MNSLKKALLQDLYGWVVPSPWRRHRFLIAVGLFGVIVTLWMLMPQHHDDKTHVTVAASVNGDDLADNMRWLSSRNGHRSTYTSSRLNRKSVEDSNQDSIVDKKAFKKMLKGVSHLDPMSHHLAKKLTTKRLAAPIEIYQGSGNHVDSKFLLIAGEVIDATIESSVSTDLAGQVRAMVTEPVYAYLSRHVLIPIGSRLLGHYQAVSHQQQMRIWVRWDRVVLPDASSLTLDSPSVDPMGQVGSLADKVNHHNWERFRDAALLSVLSNGALIAGGLDASTETAGQVLRSQVADRLSNAAEQSWVSNKTYQPTALLYPGHRIKIYIMHDIDCKQLLSTSKQVRMNDE